VEEDEPTEPRVVAAVAAAAAAAAAGGSGDCPATHHVLAHTQCVLELA
jgi:hypothetical protein